MSIETYGRYQLLKRLATGGMAQIYLARAQGPEGAGKLLVVKRILPHLTENEDFVKMFIDEARIAARLNHANVVQIFDLGAQGDSFFIAMEYIHGEDVRRLWKHSEMLGQPVPVPLVCRILIEACAGLDYAHKRTDPTTGRPLGIVHRDVSPQNILVTFEGGVKVVDFGIAKAADQATITRSGVLKGKYSYMSPEQAEGQRVDCRSDIFALGVVLYEVLTGSRLFKRPSDIQTLSAVTECRVLPPSHVNARVPQDLDAIVLKALAKDPAERYQEAAHLQAALEGWLAANGLPATAADLSAYMKELYAERLAEEAMTGEVLVGEGEPVPSPPASRRTGLKPALPPRPPVPAEEDPTASLRPRSPTPEAEKPAARMTGARRAIEPAVPSEPEAEKPAARMTGARRAIEPVVPPEPEAEKPAARMTGARRAIEPVVPPEPEAEKPAARMTGARRAIEPAVPERASRAAMGAVPVPPRAEPSATERASRAGVGAVPAPVRVETLAPERASRVDLAASERASRAEPGTSERASRIGVGAVSPARVEPLAADRGSRVGMGAVPVPARVEDRGSRVGMGAVPVPHPVEEDAPTVDGRAPGRATLTDVRAAVDAPPVPGRAVPWATPDEEEEEPTVDGRAIPRTNPQAPHAVEEDAPTLAMLEPELSSRHTSHLAPDDDSEEDAPTLSLGMSRPARKDTSTTTARVNVGGRRRGGSRPTWLVPVAGAVAALVAAALLWMALRSSDAPAPSATEAGTEARAPQVRFMADPWAEVTCGGKRLGQTPFETAELRAGTYDCRFFNPQLQKTLDRRIEVKASGLNVVSVKFD